MNIKISPRDRLIIVGVILLIALVASVFLLVMPQISRIKELDSQIALSNNQAASARTLLEQRRQMKDNSASTETMWLRLANLVPENPELPSLVIELQDTAYDSGVQIRRITPSTPLTIQNQTYLSLPMSLEVLGTWQDTVDFLQSLSKLSRAVRIVSVSCDVVTDSPSDVVPKLPSYSVRTALTIEAYTIPAVPTGK